jgi:CRP-like cAMP-binding protein
MFSAGADRLRRAGSKFSKFARQHQSNAHKKIAQREKAQYWAEEFRTGFKRSRLLLRGYLIRQQMFFNPVTRKYTKMSISDLAGHGAFLSLAVSYTETDIYLLRVYAVSGVALSMIFQFYREKPLYLPLKWNWVFLTINIAMIARILKQERDAARIPDEQKRLYVKLFQEKGMHSVEFMRLMAAATRTELVPGEYLAKQGETRTSLQLIVKGNGRVVRDGEEIGSVEKHQFVGEMSYLAWQSRKLKEMKKIKNQHHKEKDSDIREEPTENNSIGVDATNSSFPVLFSGVSDAINTLRVSSGMLVGLMKGKSTSESSSSSLPNAKHMITRGIDGVELKAANTDENDTSITTSTTTSYNNTDNTSYNANRTWQEWWEGLSSNGSDDACSCKSRVASTTSADEDDGDVEEKGESHKFEVVKFNESSSKALLVGSASVQALEPCVIYTFEFEDLHTMITDSSAMGVVFERCLSSDLNKKLMKNIESGPEKRYRQMMTEFLGKSNNVPIPFISHTNHVNQTQDPLSPKILSSNQSGGEPLTAKEIKFLENFREQSGISIDIRAKVLQLCGWTEREFLRGYRGGASDEQLCEYNDMLNSLLQRKRVALKAEQDRNANESTTTTPAVSAADTTKGNLKHAILDNKNNNKKKSTTEEERVAQRSIQDTTTITKADRNRLRKARRSRSITYAQHLHTLALFGVTGDQYESGKIPLEAVAVTDGAEEEEEDEEEEEKVVSKNKKKYYIRFWLND